MHSSTNRKNQKLATGSWLLACAMAALAGCGGGTSLTDPTTSDDAADASDASDALTCGAGQLACGASCVDPQLDPSNCGGCGNVCGEGQVCSNGTCGSTCASTQTLCTPDGGAAFCASTQSDNANCGACGHACGVGQVCSAGTCASQCTGTQTLCTPDGGAAFCASTQSDNANCGACGHACGVGQVCSNGACGSTCSGTQTLCTPDGGVAYCASTQSDNANCGSCGHACGVGQVCSAGTCASQCTGTQTLCTPDGGAAYCASTQSDNANCGACGHACGVGQVCSAGTCASQCTGTQTLCTPAGGAAYCADTTSDNANCGSCGTACGTGQSCVGGACKVACSTGLSLCGSACIDTTTDPNHCGSCANACAGGQVCRAGSCVGLLASWTFDPAGSTVDVTGHGYDATNTSATPALGYAQNALSFDGFTSKLTAPFLDLNGKSFTVEAWIQPGTQSGQDNPVVIEGPFQTDTILHLTVRNQRLYFGFGNDDLPGSTALSLGTNTWYHAAWTYDASTKTQTIYLNGVQDAVRTANAQLAIPSTSSLLLGGAPPWQTQPFHGLLDEVKVYGYARSASEILEDASLLTHLAFDGNALDVGPNHLWTSSASASFAPGVFGQAMSFDGTASLFQAWNLTTFGPEAPFSLEAWIDPSAPAGDVFYLSQAQNGGGSCVPYLGFANGKLTARVWNGATGDTVVVAPTTPPSGTWTHVAQTWSAATGLKLYVNGVNVASTATTHNDIGPEPFLSLGGGFSFCDRGQGRYAGLVDDVRVYQRVRTDAEIAADATK